ncbi:MAG: MXAN_5187 C-terminal domain-containing protein [Myxococcales bacterium]
MFLSKIWFILVAVAAGVALSIALTAPRPMAQKLEELEGQRLDRAQYAAEQMLKVDAHKWIDRVAKLGRDAIVSEALDGASHGTGELGVQHKTVQSRIRSLLPDLSTAGIATIIALDGNGRVVARVGDDEKDYGDNIGGAEVISDALRGYLSDDVWGAGGHLLRVAGGPVLSKSRDRIVGALVIGAETGAQFADRLKRNLDMDVALLLHGKVVASTIDAALLSPLPQLVSQHQTEIDDVKRTPAIPLDVGSETYLAVAAAFPGQASQQQGYYVLIGKKPAKADLQSLLANTSARHLKWGSFPWISLVGSILAVVAIGLFLQHLEVEAPIARMRAELRTLARGEAVKLNDHRYGGGFGSIARDVNAAVEHYAMSSLSGATAVHASGAVAVDAPAAGSAFANNGPGFGMTGPAAAAVSPGFPAPPPAAFAPPPPAAFAPPLFPQPARAKAAPTVPPAAPAALFDTTSGGVVDPADDDQHVQQVYLQFLATKQQCGESAAGLTLDKFRQRLQENKAALMSKHDCRTVRFSVYVKDGKASLRATPVK